MNRSFDTNTFTTVYRQLVIDTRIRRAENELLTMRMYGDNLTMTRAQWAELYADLGNAQSDRIARLLIGDDLSVCRCTCGAESFAATVDTEGIECGFRHRRGCATLASIRENETCTRLLVGQGDDTYDPECVLPRGHSGSCRA